jgi:methylmalonyl-CoA/ethylmalonyl-CoA epimerase
MSGQPESPASERQPKPLLRRLDHVAVAVRDTEEALQYFIGVLGLEVAYVDELESPPVTLTYLDAGNIYIQLVSPRAPCEIARWLDEHGEGLHHICFSVDDVVESVRALSDGDGQLELGSGRGRLAAFIRNGSPFGVPIECTEFRPGDGVARTLPAADT